MSHSPVPASPDNSRQPTERERFPYPLIFSQRYGYEPLPEPMQLKQLSRDLRNDVCDAINEFLEGMRFTEECVDNGWGETISMNYFTLEKRHIIISILARISKRPKTRLKVDYNDYEKVVGLFSSIILEKEFNQVLDFLEIVFDELSQDKSFTDNQKKRLAEEIKSLFEKHSAAYWLDTSQHPYRFLPRASQEQGDAIQEAIEMLHQEKMNEATTKFRKATKDIKMHQYGDSIAQSINAVESIAREIAQPKNTLGKVLNYLGRKGFFQDNAREQLKEALVKLSVYANNFRHGNPESSTIEAGLDEAMLLYGTCASFAAYLTRKHQSRENRQDLKENPE